MLLFISQIRIQCWPGSVPGLEAICEVTLLLVFSSAPSGFSPGSPVFPSPQKPSSQNSNSIRMQDLPDNHVRVSRASWVNISNYPSSTVLSWTHKKTSSVSVNSSGRESLLTSLLTEGIMISTTWGVGMAHWWEHWPPANVARVRFLNSASYVGWVCWFSTLHREVFSGYSGFPLLNNQPTNLICWFQFTVSQISSPAL